MYTVIKTLIGLMVLPVLVTWLDNGIAKRIEANGFSIPGLTPKIKEAQFGPHWQGKTVDA